MKIAFPVNKDEGLNSVIASHFGRAKAFIIYDSESKQTVTIPITKHQENKCIPVKILEGFDLDAIYVFGLGWRALNLLEEKNIKAKTGSFTTVQEVVGHLDDLEDLETTCGGH